MKISADHLRRLSALNLSGESYSEILSVISEMQAADECRLENQRLRKARSRDGHGTASRDKGVTVTVTPPPTYTTPPKKDSSKKNLSISMPQDFEFNEPDSRAIAKAGWTEQYASAELARFKDHAAAKGRKCVDWHAAWRNWVTSPFQKPNGNGGSHAANPHGKTLSDVACEMLDKIGDDESPNFDRLLSQVRSE